MSADTVSAAEADSTAANTEQNKLRKRIQNRIYQRAFRLRNGANKKSKPRSGQRQFHVNRWRLDEELNTDQKASEIGASLTSVWDMSGQDSYRESRHIVVQAAPEQSATATWFPLTADHLIHLIKYNVFRGLRENKGLIDCRMVQYRTSGKLSETMNNRATFPSYSVIFPMEPDDSGPLSPTPIQMSVIHSSWIDFLPCSTMRNNLILQESEFSHADFVKDLVGNLINLNIFVTVSSSSAPVSSNGIDGPLADDCISSDETGLVLWGEPHLIESWEVTPNFLRQWGWAVVGCQKLIDSTNYWRDSRGETPLQLLLPL